ncbi:MAG: DAK2 domain-containing protein [Syntrophomonadaceae bacterium]|nr:DAK2 domain-containing protein [Syntrophomonadaceae bacterium]
MLKEIYGNDLVRMVKAGCIRLEQNRDEVNKLNVFPVPDGDTGTNMYLTLLSAVKEGEKNSALPLGKVAKCISMGSLMGARGNSGVILSQIFRGLARELEHKDKATAKDVARALRIGSDTAYKAVMKPVEGTILTVIREIAAACQREAEENEDIIACMQKGLTAGRRTLARTPQMLPILREAGVVDAGGSGLLYFLEGAISGLAEDNDIPFTFYEPESKEPILSAVPDALPYDGEEVELDFQYCTELLIKGEALDCDIIQEKLGPLGDSMLVVGGDELVKVHIHSNHPGRVLETALTYGELSDIKINNMLEEVHEHRQQWEGQQPAVKPEAPAPGIGLVAVASGEGISDILLSLGVDCLVEGGQTMNPSTEDLLRACEICPSLEVIILPNNGNIVLAAEQAAELCDKPVRVVPSKSVMQGISSLVAYQPDGELEEVTDEMKDAMTGVCYGEITTAVRDTELNGFDIQEGDVIGLVDGTIMACGDSVAVVLGDLLELMMDDDAELVTLLYGEGMEAEAAEGMAENVAEAYPQCEVECHFGGQPHYSFYIGVE